jgi:hypothetical protein
MSQETNHWSRERLDLSLDLFNDQNQHVFVRPKFLIRSDLSRETYDLSPDLSPQINHMSQETNDRSRETKQMSLDCRPAFK